MGTRPGSSRFLPEWLDDLPVAVLLGGSLSLLVGVAFITKAAGLDPSPGRAMIGIVGFGWVFGTIALWRWLVASTRLYRLREGLA